MNPTEQLLDPCCQKEIESNRRYNEMQKRYQRHDIVAARERQRRHLVNVTTLTPTTMTDGQQQQQQHGIFACRCSFDPNLDGQGNEGEYRSLRELRTRRNNNDINTVENNHDDNNNKYDVDDNDDNDDDKDDKELSNENNNNNNTRSGETEADSDDDSEYDYLLDELDAVDTNEPNNNCNSNSNSNSNSNNNNNNNYMKEIKLLEEHRRYELEYELLRHEIAIQHGFGTYRYIHPRRVLQEAGLVVGVQVPQTQKQINTEDPFYQSNVVVLHLFDPDSIASASLDIHLEQLLQPVQVRQTNNNNNNNQKVGQGTKFMKSNGRTVLMTLGATTTNGNFKIMSSSIRIDTNDIPALIGIRDGVIITISRKLNEFKSNTNKNYNNNNNDDCEIIPYLVDEWLDRCGLLNNTIPNMEYICRIRPEQDALLESMKGIVLSSNQQQSIMERYDCGIPNCNKSFFHEHIGISNEQQNGLLVTEQDLLI